MGRVPKSYTIVYRDLCGGWYLYHCLGLLEAIQIFMLATEALAISCSAARTLGIYRTIIR